MLCLGWRIMSRGMLACLGSYHYVMSRGKLTVLCSVTTVKRGDCLFC
jgi:hypothetical protein